MSEDAYKTLLQEGYDEFIVQKSRFIGYACPVGTQEEALLYISKIKDKHRDASHHCYAYIISLNRGIIRYHDDGEPGGTAGQPILKIIKQKGLINACVVVVRYFGGTLLGTGGLARAYSQGAKSAVCAAGEILMEPSVQFSLTIPYVIWDKLQHDLKNLPIQIGQAVFTQEVRVNIIIRVFDQEKIEKAIADASDGRVQSLEINRMYYPWPSA